MKNKDLAMLVGGAFLVGAAVALLFAPEKGSDTRKKIKDMIEDGYDKIKDTCCHGSCEEE